MTYGCSSAPMCQSGVTRLMTLPETTEANQVHMTCMPTFPNAPCVPCLLYQISVVGRRGRPTRGTSYKYYEIAVMVKRSNRRLRRRDYIRIHVLADYNVISYRNVCRRGRRTKWNVCVRVRQCKRTSSTNGGTTAT